MPVRSSARCSSLILLATCIFLIPFTASSQAPQAENQSAHPVLIELFTSEGCSSCPPADILLQSLDRDQPVPGAQLIVLSEHVTYWDQQGWKDPNSSSALTERQSSYEKSLGEKEVFTPHMIVNGIHQLRKGNSEELKDMLEKAKDDQNIAVRVGEIKFDPANPTTLLAHIETNANLTTHNADVYLAVALDHVESQVLRGENGGKHLVHVAVVQQLNKVGKLPKGKSFSQDLQVKLNAGTDPGNLRVIAFIQESGPGKILGATRGIPAS